MKRTRLIPVLAAFAASQALHAQDPQLSQWYAAPQYLNPALAGNTLQDRVSLNYRLQWPGVQPGYETYAFAYDHRFAGANSGLGGYVMRDQAGRMGLNFTTLAMSYSYEARVNYRHAFRLGIRAGYTMRGLSPDGYLFADQVIRDNAPTTIEPMFLEQVNYMDMAAGGLYYTEQVWVGFSVNHLNTPNQSLISDGIAPLAMRTSVHAGYKFPIDGRVMNRSESKMTLAAHYKGQDKWDQFDMGGYVDHGRLSLGMWYRGIPIFKAYQPGYDNSEAVVLMAGVATESQFRFTYSFDITVSKMSMKSGGAHEISMIYEWPRKVKGRKHKVVPCPKF